MEPTQRRLLPSTASLSAFDAVARLGSMSAAAAALSLTPGAISRHVALLEAQLGVALITRTNRGVELTEKGRRYAEGADSLLRSLRLLSLEAMSDNASAGFGLAILPTFGTRWLMPRMPSFLRQHPGLTVNFATRIGRVDFGAERLDAAIHVGKPDWPDGNFRFLMREHVVPVCSPQFLRENPVTSPEALISMPLLEMASRPEAWQHWFSTLGVRRSHHEGMRFEQFMHVSQACIAGLGVALMPLFLIEAELQEGTLVKAFDRAIESRSSYYFVTPAHRQTHPAAQRMSDWLSTEIEAAGLA
ncbi:DNA-binding transcriptional regulator, LysR family [Ensifer adhaerens]|nr:DNA-binding transcriptional regulator, LysR family [Ensifer adhaerens]